jgi:hypothetical protein
MIKKPPVSSSIGIEIKPPPGIKLSGETTVVPEVVTHPITLTVFLDDDTSRNTPADTQDSAYELVYEWCQYGFSKITSSNKTVHYPPHRIRKIEIITEKL